MKSTNDKIDVKKEILEIADYLGCNGEELYSELAKLNQLISKREIEARIDELAIFVDELNDRDPYVPLPGTPRDYVMDKFMKRLAKLTELQEGKNNDSSI